MQEVYSKVLETLCEHREFNVQSMAAMQSMGLHGFAALHRCRVEQIQAMELDLIVECFDMTRTKVDFPDIDLEYDPRSIKSHLMEWDQKLDQGILELGKLQVLSMSEKGIYSLIIPAVTALFASDYADTGRWYSRFEDVDWLAHDIHVVDDQIYYTYHKDVSKGRFEAYKSVVKEVGE